MRQHQQPRADASGLRIGIAVSRYHSDVTALLRDAALRSFAEAAGRREDLVVVESPGSFELTAICRELAASGLDAVVALGCIIQGQTRHDRYLAAAVAQGLTAVSVQSGVPVAFGVLTCKTLDQARQRAGGDRGDKGAEAMTAAIMAARAIQAIRRGATA